MEGFHRATWRSVLYVSMLQGYLEKCPVCVHVAGLLGEVQQADR